MKNRNELSRVLWIVTGFSVAGCLLGALGVITGTDGLCILGVMVMFASVIYHFRRYRCPCCHRYLDRSMGRYCQHCGQELR